MKICKNCKVEKDITYFNKKKQAKDGYSYNCKQCDIDYAKLKRVPDYWRNQWLKRKYKITVKDYQLKFENQHGLCAICKKPEEMKRLGKLTRLSVDHCHLTRKD